MAGGLRMRGQGPGVGMAYPRTEIPETPRSTADQSLEDFSSNVRIVGVQEFDEVSFDRMAPLVVKGAVERASKKWTDKWLLQRFGRGYFQVSLDSRPALTPFKKRMALSEYLETLEKSKGSGQPSEYLFHSRRNLQEVADLLEDVDVPDELLSLGDPIKWRFFVGPAHAGTLPHHHSYAINALARGRKRWAIYVGADPSETKELLDEGYRDYDSGSQAKDWFLRECPKLRSQRVQLWEFVQEAGDLVYIPAFFIHAIVNLEPVVGFTVELKP